MHTFLTIVLLILIVSCHNPSQKKETLNIQDTTANARRSMKGFDLYAWEKDGITLFTLLPGTNRNKTSAEIYDVNNAVAGISAIEQKINQIDSGEYIFLTAIRIDTNDLKPLIAFMNSKKLKVTIIP